MSLQSSYPDILGQLAGERLTVDGVLQCALGIFPTTTALDRPVEVLLLLQNLTDRRLPLAITVETPRYDAAGDCSTSSPPGLASRWRCRPQNVACCTSR